MREKGQTEAAKTLETPVFSRGIEILTEKNKILEKGCILRFQRKYPLRDFVYLQFNSPFLLVLTMLIVS